MKKSTKIWALLFPLWILLIQVLAFFPSVIETYYSQFIYAYLANFFHLIVGEIPFSVGDLFYFLVIIFVIFWLFKQIRKKQNLQFYLIQIIAFASKVYLFFHLIWGLNYYREPIHKTLEIENEYNHQELINYTDKIIHQANLIHYKITQNDSLPVDYNRSYKQVKKEVFLGFQNLDTDLNLIDYNYQNIKYSLLSLPLSYAGFGGYLNPFTLEAQYNGRIPAYRWNFTISHEVAHQLGYAKENEANFIAFMMNVHQPNLKQQYSALIFAVRQCMNEIYRRDPVLFELYKEKINKGILKNYEQMEIFREKHQSIFEPIMKSIYTKFLNINNQPEGLKSYSYVVSLMINHDKKVTSEKSHSN
ncbi:MAG: DUF3810 domain-containing protein [Bacteroidota bacterium]